MATSMAAAVSRSMMALRSSSQSLLTRSPHPLRSLSRRFLSSTFQRPHPLPVRFRQAVLPLSWRLNQVRFSVSPAVDSTANFLDTHPSDELPQLFPGCDGQHWLIVMDKPGGERATKEQMIDCYIQTVAKVLGSEEEAKKKIYSVTFHRHYRFGCEIDEETANKFEEIPGVLYVLPDSYVDPEYKDYGAELLVDGEIVQRSPERQRRVDEGCDIPKYKKRSREKAAKTDENTMTESDTGGAAAKTDENTMTESDTGGAAAKTDENTMTESDTEGSETTTESDTDGSECEEEEG